MPDNPAKYIADIESNAGKNPFLDTYSVSLAKKLASPGHPKFQMKWMKLIIGFASTKTPDFSYVTGELTAADNNGSGKRKRHTHC